MTIRFNGLSITIQALIFSLVSPQLFSSESCQFLARGTTVPNTSGTPLVINQSTGTVISANFFGSGAIDPPFFDGNESISVCVKPASTAGVITAELFSDVGLDNDTDIKGYPQFLIGTKFGNIFETSFRFYSNTNLPAIHQWPVVASNNSQDNQPFEFANLEYVSQVKGIGLPAFTSNLPNITIKLDIDEVNVVGSERDVMLESWFYDTSANAALIGNNIANGQPIAGTLNNIVGIGHPHYSELDNTLLEMMVHIGPLSTNDVSNAQRNPGQNQLTEIFSGKDADSDGIDDHFDVDSHLNLGTNIEPQPGKYSSGIDNNSDGIDDADLLPVQIGAHLYSIWFGESYLSPIVIFSRETNDSLTSNFDPNTPDTDLTNEGEINLDWNAFLAYTMTELESKLQNAADTPYWATEPSNLFSKINSQHVAIGGIELGIEPQINNQNDQPYTVTLNTFDVVVDGMSLGLTDRNNPTVHDINPADSTTIQPDPNFNISGFASDDASGVNRVLVRVERRDISPREYWNGTTWQVSPTGTFERATLVDNEWSLTAVDLSEPGDYRIQFTVRDRATNQGPSNQNPVIDFTVAVVDNTIPTTTLTTPANGSTVEPGSIKITGSASDDMSDIDRVLVRVQTVGRLPAQFWNGSQFQNDPIWIPATLDIDGRWFLNDVTLEDSGRYKTLLRVFDTAGNQAVSSQNPQTIFTVPRTDFDNPVVNILSPVDNETISSGTIALHGTYFDGNSGINRVLVRLQTRDKSPTLFWNGLSFQENPRWLPASLQSDGTWALPNVSTTNQGTYRVLLRAIDNAGNQAYSNQNPRIVFTVK